MLQKSLYKKITDRKLLQIVPHRKFKRIFSFTLIELCLFCSCFYKGFETRIKIVHTQIVVTSNLDHHVNLCTLPNDIYTADCYYKNILT
jgi:hypothetical protein